LCADFWAIRRQPVRRPMANLASTENTIVPNSFESSAAVNDSHITSEEVQADSSGRFQTGFGCLRCRPACLQFLTSARWFLLFLALSAFFQSMVVNGLFGVTISTIERRFGLSSSQTAWIIASYEIAGVPALLIIGYLGSTLRRPVWIGAGLIMLGVGFGVYSIPHFAAPPYRYVESGDSSNLCVETSSNSSTNGRCGFKLCECQLFLTNSLHFMSLHSAAILTVLCYFVLPRRSGSRTLGIKDTFY